ncbi:glycosyltransferase family 4 protein [Salinarimonas ramus]|uniref:Glycosyl transferase n=1 Tax=Salinarimonas ramus TaxID=690164 RepID=A0A917QBM4_9HYPH|nr:glycosyltransferase family 4 protein [Salinarimonas ramus]GGK41443.1 glycosyl transferase [Salinarimonas ramus]
MATLAAAFAVPGALETPTGGYAYAREILARFPTHGIDAQVVRLPGGFPNPTTEDLVETARLLAAVPGEAALLVDGLAYGALPAATLDAFARPLVALVHHPLGLESGIAPDRAAALIETERRALARATRVVTTSPTTARTLVSDFGVPPDRLTVAEPGTEPAARAAGAPAGAPPALVAMGAVTPRKGYDVLIAALARLADRPWSLTIVGATDRAPDLAAALAAQVREAGLAERIRFTGAVDDATRDALMAGADAFVSASLYEGYGMVLAEAMARGLPLVASTGGAAAETAPDAAALKVPPGDVDALADALARMLGDDALRRRLADASFAAGRRLPTWDDTTARIARVLHDSLETTR